MLKNIQNPAPGVPDAWLLGYLGKDHRRPHAARVITIPAGCTPQEIHEALVAGWLR